MSRLLILLFGIVSTVAVGVLLFSLYRYANSVVPPSEALDLHHASFQKNSTRKNDTIPWLQQLALRKKPSFAYAVSEMQIELPLKKRPVPKRTYRLVLKDLDGYKIFCIRQVLEQNGIEYAMFRENRNGVLVIHDLTKENLDKIVRLVKEYDVHLSIENSKKD